MTDNTQPEALRLANEFKLCNEYDSIPSITDIAKAEAELRRQHARIAELEGQREELLEAAQQTSVMQHERATLLPDGSAFAVVSYSLPKTHWLYAPREYEDGADEPKDLPTPILTHAQRESAIAAIRYAIRGATMCGKVMDFDPDALVQNAVYALCGPYGQADAPQPARKAGEKQ